MPDEKIFFIMLIEALRLVASDAEIQIEALPTWVHIPDEVVLTFDESYVLFDQVIKAGLVNSGQAETVHKLHNHIREMSLAHDPALWTIEAMKDNPKWHEMRTLAIHALSGLGHNIDRPNLGWMTYIPGGD